MSVKAGISNQERRGFGELANGGGDDDKNVEENSSTPAVFTNPFQSNGTAKSSGLKDVVIVDNDKANAKPNSIKGKSPVINDFVESAILSGERTVPGSATGGNTSPSWLETFRAVGNHLAVSMNFRQPRQEKSQQDQQSQQNTELNTEQPEESQQQKITLQQRGKQSEPLTAQQRSKPPQPSEQEQQQVQTTVQKHKVEQSRQPQSQQRTNFEKSGDNGTADAATSSSTLETSSLAVTTNLQQKQTEPLRARQQSKPQQVSKQDQYEAQKQIPEEQQRSSEPPPPPRQAQPEANGEEIENSVAVSSAAAAASTSSSRIELSSLTSIRQMSIGLSEHQRSLHKEILFNLFLQHTDGKRVATLDAIDGNEADQNEVATSLKKILAQRRKVKSSPPGALSVARLPTLSNTAADNNANRSFLLSRIPLTLASAKKRENGYQNEKEKSLRQRVIARTLKEVQDEYEKTAQRWPRAGVYGKNYRKNSVNTAKPFTLKFNECSVAAIAEWAWGTMDKPSSTSEKKGERSIAKSLLDTPSAHEDFGKAHGTKLIVSMEKCYRKCGICKLWGHYEMECPNKTPLQLAKELLLESKNQENQELVKSEKGGDNSSQPIINLDNEKKKQSVPFRCIVEDCEGYLIEQSNQHLSSTTNCSRSRHCLRQEKKKSKKQQSWECVPDFYGFSIQAGKTPSHFNKRREAEEASFQSVFVEGDMVAWCGGLLEDDSSSNLLDRNSDGMVHTGLILDSSANKGKILVEYISTCPRDESDVDNISTTATKGKESSYFPSRQPWERGSSVFIPLEKLHLVDEALWRPTNSSNIIPARKKRRRAFC